MLVFGLLTWLWFLYLDVEGYKGVSRAASNTEEDEPVSATIMFKPHESLRQAPTSSNLPPNNNLGGYSSPKFSSGSSTFTHCPCGSLQSPASLVPTICWMRRHQRWNNHERYSSIDLKESTIISEVDGRPDPGLSGTRGGIVDSFPPRGARHLLQASDRRLMSSNGSHERFFETGH